VGTIAARLGLPLVFVIGGGVLVVTVVVMVFTAGRYLCRPPSEN
jgi:hypothetical protein